MTRPITSPPGYRADPKQVSGEDNASALRIATSAHATHRRGLGSPDAAGANRSADSGKHESGHNGVDVSTAAVGGGCRVSRAVRGLGRSRNAVRIRQSPASLPALAHPAATSVSAPVAAPPTRATARARLQSAADRAASKHIGDSRNRGIAGSRRSRSPRYTVDLTTMQHLWRQAGRRATDPI